MKAQDVRGCLGRRQRLTLWVFISRRNGTDRKMQAAKFGLAAISSLIGYQLPLRLWVSCEHP
jgi:hypothetical protein